MVKIVELRTGFVKFISEEHEIETIQLYDVIGNKIYDLNVKSNEMVFNLVNLSQAPYIARLNLVNGQTVIKKSVKRL